MKAVYRYWLFAAPAANVPSSNLLNRLRYLLLNAKARQKSVVPTGQSAVYLPLPKLLEKDE